MNLLVVGTAADQAVFAKLSQIADSHTLPLDLSWQTLPKLSGKFLSSIAYDHSDALILAIIKGAPMLIKASDGNLIKSYLNWQSSTNRIVNAGRKSELILQACKLTSQMRVIDATAGFGHDSLILASTGAQVLMLEQHAVVALLLMYEKQRMHANPNWRKLLARLQIVCGSFLDSQLMATLPNVDVVYLDPMFPQDSYTAKVNKNMQILHDLAPPPDSQEAQSLLAMAHTKLLPSGKIIVKRPLTADNLAGVVPVQTIQNDAIRFDKYSSFELDA